MPRPASYQRAQELLDKNFISKEARDVAKGNMDKALAKQQQDECCCRNDDSAPFWRPRLAADRPGAYVKAGTTSYGWRISVL
jgi:hypothetical protein